MDSPSQLGRRPGAFSPMPSTPSSQLQVRPQHQRSQSSESDSSSSSQLTAMSTGKRQPYQQRPALISTQSSNSSTTSLHNFTRPSISHVVNDVPSRKNSPLNPGNDPRSHKRNNSQGFFEPSLPTASLVDQSSMSGLTASQIAAQAAMMQQQGSNQHFRKRSQTVPSPHSPPEGNSGIQGRAKQPPPNAQAAGLRKQSGGAGTPQYYNGTVGSPTIAAATAANAAFPRAPQLSPGLTTFSEQAPPPLPLERDVKTKSERSKMKLFSKPKHIGIPGYKDVDKKDRPLPSPGKMGSPGPSLLSKNINASTTSLADSLASGASSMYGMQNSSTSTLVPGDRQRADDKEKAHRHHFLSRQKNKLKEKMDDHAFTLSSASSNSKLVDPSAPPSIYNFAPSSPGISQTSFSKSVSGLDLRHGGRALREKKREERAGLDGLRADGDKNEWLTGTVYGAPNVSSASIYSGTTGPDIPFGNLQGFGVSNMTPDDAWDFLKAKLLIIFEGEELKMPIEELNRLVNIHFQRCVQKRAPNIIVNDLEDLLLTGFNSLGHSLRGIPDDKLVPYLVEMWLFVFGFVLPYIQAVFLPLDMELKGHGNAMTLYEAAEQWGFFPDSTDGFENEIEVRRLVLMSYRDNVILPRHDTLKAIFSRLSLESINVGVDSPAPLPSPRPGTSGSFDPGYGSFNSQGSTLLGDGNRSRATSNTSAPELPSFSPPLRTQVQPDSSQVTEMVGRMLQCMSVLSSLQSNDDSQEKMEGLTKALKLNWLGRGRTGRNRKGFVGARMPRVSPVSS